MTSIKRPMAMSRKWDYGTEFKFSDWVAEADPAVRVHIMDTKDELISDWNVTVDYNNSIDDLNLSKILMLPGKAQNLTQIIPFQQMIQVYTASVMKQRMEFTG